MSSIEGQLSNWHRGAQPLPFFMYIKRVKETHLPMATRSRIGIQLKDESVLSVYHHWDGYPEWLGRILKTHYNTKEKVEELIDGGNMSSCWSDKIWGEKLPEGEYAPEYYTARGEKIEDNAPRHDQTVEEYLANGEEYAYIFRDGEWVAYDCHESEDMWAPEIVRIPVDALAC